ncbi:hypothetical protein [Desulfosporosinus hippei]|uniref:Lipoprotein n=1 Tax=Desulfosporosinus hippei DSM 8344 TaxID=1121419 RepID=A0A1G8JA64_9FIRM|nr:hypothetical protein [Desulfosporosinus hippei]SDI28076.1 hypothetical protein SAMN05443529_1327 [Desulfosporosinus hippei DSM 8344]
MKKLNRVQKTTRKSWLISGLILSLVLLGVSGCSSQAASTSASDTASNSKEVSSNQQNPGPGARPSNPNPAVEAAMSIRRLQANEQLVLTSDQKESIKPILQVLIDTENPGQDFLQQKADDINAIFTEEQKTFLSTSPERGTPREKRPDNQNQPQGQPNERPKDQTEGSKGNQTPPAGQFQEIYKEVLASLT